MTFRIVFRASARRDIEVLAGHSEIRWGKRQTRQYLDELESNIQQLVDNPLRYPEFEPRPNLRRMNCGRHAVFYAVEEGRIEIVRVLHVASDLNQLI
ncbi:MAG: type II toxin-antitoxin system RelE/ParE family toxin [Alphaproteobacteria bacterium]|nr:type II toxin-antitoxin system RelE/ParE family toxin [Alphaproteobacteria bacterium]